MGKAWKGYVRLRAGGGSRPSFLARARSPRVYFLLLRARSVGGRRGVFRRSHTLTLMLRTQDGKRLARLLFYSRIQKMSTLCPQNCRADFGRFARRGEGKALRNGSCDEYRKRARRREGSAASRTASAALGAGRVDSQRGAGIADIRRRRGTPPARFADARPIYGFCVKSEALCGAVPDGGGQPVRVSSASVMSMPSESPDQLTLSRTVPRCSMTPPECSFSSPPRLR